MPNRCALEGCGEEPLNYAVPACDKHLCDECRMGVGFLRSEKSDIRICARCYQG